MTWPPPTRREFLVDPDCPRRVARALQRSRLTQRPLQFVIGFYLLIAVVATVVRAFDLAVCIVVVLIVIVLLPMLLSGRVARVMRARGFEPGTLLVVEYWADRFTVQTARSQAVYWYHELRGVRRFDDIVIVRTTTSRVVLPLPVPLVPPEMLAVLTGAAAGANPRSRT